MVRTTTIGGGEIHVYPLGDLREHVLKLNCWCRPESDESGVIVHNSMDGREKYETGERRPS